MSVEPPSMGFLPLEKTMQTAPSLLLVAGHGPEACDPGKGSHPTTLALISDFQPQER